MYKEMVVECSDIQLVSRQVYNQVMLSNVAVETTEVNRLLGEHPGVLGPTWSFRNLSRERTRLSGALRLMRSQTYFHTGWAHGAQPHLLISVHL